MSEPAATGPPTPPPHYGLDPISEAIGELKADVRAIREDVRAKASTSELRVWGSLIVLVLAGLFAAVFRLAERLPAP